MENYFQKLSEIKCEIEKKNGLNYISWSDAWSEVKKIYPDATYKKIMNTSDNSFLFKSGTGGMVMCEVTINGITHTTDLAVTDFKNQEIPYERIKSTDIQNTSQRVFAKAIAMHGIGLYVYRGEDLPTEDKQVENTTHEVVPTAPKKAPDKPWIKQENIDTLIKAIKDKKIKASSGEAAVKIASNKYRVSKESEQAIKTQFSEQII